MERICVFAGSASGSKSSYSESAQLLGAEIARRNFSMVYGGGSNGLMGEVANSALSGGASVTGIITEKLDKVEVGHKGLTRLEVVPTMHDRSLEWQNYQMQSYLYLVALALGKNFLKH